MNSAPSLIQRVFEKEQQKNGKAEKGEVEKKERISMPDETTDQVTFEGWCILEILGHRRLGGYIREQEIAGATFLRIDIPREKEGPAVEATQFYSPTSVYCLTPVSETMARAVALRNKPQPVQRWELPSPKTSPNNWDQDAYQGDDGDFAGEYTEDNE
jgi:hypothetical protein